MTSNTKCCKFYDERVGEKDKGVFFHANVWYHRIIGYLLCLGQDLKDLHSKYNLSFVS